MSEGNHIQSNGLCICFLCSVGDAVGGFMENIPSPTSQRVTLLGTLGKLQRQLP